MATDPELLRRYVAGGSQDAFAELARRHLSLVYSAALRRTGANRALAEDVAQQVFVRLARNANGLVRHPALSGWLYLTTRNVAINLMKAEGRRQAREREAALMHDLSSGTEDRAQAERIRPILDDLMDRLSERERVALFLRFFENLRFAEVGGRLAIREDAARRRVERALDKLRDGLNRRGIGSSAAALAALLTEEAATAASPSLLASVYQAAAAVPVHSGGATGLWQLMSTTKTSLGLAGILGAAALLSIPAIGIAVHEWQAGQRARAELALADQKYGASQKQLERLKASEADAERRQAELQAQVARWESTRGGKGNVAAGPAGRHPARDAKADGRMFLTAYPQARSVLADFGRAKVAAAYAGFFRSAGLTSAQIGQFEDLAVANWLNRLALSPTSISAIPYQDLIPSDQLSQVLDANTAQQFEDYNRSVEATIMAERIASVIGTNSELMTADQIDQLAKIVAANSASYQNGGPVQDNTIDWIGVQTQMKSLVSASQWPTAEALLNYAQSFQAMAQARSAH